MNNKVQMILLCKQVMFRWTNRVFRWTNKLVFGGVRYNIRRIRMYEPKGIDSETTRINIVSIKIHAINISYHNSFPSWWRDANGKKGIRLSVTHVNIQSNTESKYIHIYISQSECTCISLNSLCYIWLIWSSLKASKSLGKSFLGYDIKLANTKSCCGTLPDDLIGHQLRILLRMSISV